MILFVYRIMILKNYEIISTFWTNYFLKSNLGAKKKKKNHFSNKYNFFAIYSYDRANNIRNWILNNKNPHDSDKTDSRWNDWCVGVSSCVFLFCPNLFIRCSSFENENISRIKVNIHIYPFRFGNYRIYYKTML